MKLKLKPFEVVTGNSPAIVNNKNCNYMTISHSKCAFRQRALYNAEFRVFSINQHNLEHTGNKRGRLGLVIYMKRYFGTEVSIKPKRFRNGRINPHICTVLGAKGQELFDAFDEWFVEPPKIVVTGSDQQLGRQQAARDVNNLTLLPWDQLFEV